MQLSNQMAPRINNRVFRNAHVNHYYKPDDEYVMYLQGRRANRQVCWLDFPFLLNTDFKNVLQCSTVATYRARSQY